VERALDIALLGGALAQRSGLPTPEQLQDLLATAEIGLVLRQDRIAPELLDTAWYLHGIASVSGAADRYTLVRQRQAFLVSAHVFDLAMANPDRSREEMLSFGFASAIGYRRGGREPNATAISERLRRSNDQEFDAIRQLALAPLEVGAAFLGLDARTLFQRFAIWRRQFADLATISELSDLRSTAYGPSQFLTLGAEDLLHFLVRGNLDRRERGLGRLRAVVADEVGPEDLNAKWVAAHILQFVDEAWAGSVWNPTILPPSVPSVVRQSFASGSPAVVTLWEPQRNLLVSAPSPLDGNVTRMVLAVPTSGGKTLMAQLLAADFLAQSDRSVCYVVPTRSLGREVRRAMGRRVRMLQKEAGPELPDYPTLWDLMTFDSGNDGPSDVDVMTPERLVQLIRHDAQGTLDRYGMFVFDEAQLLKEQGRGFALESAIAALDLLTQETDHRIALISAAMGNVGSIAQWLSPDGEALVNESDWRGPRRLHAVFNTDADWDLTSVESGAGTVWPFRHTTELKGIIRLRLANGQVTTLSTQGDTGWRLVRKSKDGGDRPQQTTVDGSRSTKNYVIAADMVRALGHAGSVLVVATTKAQAQSLAAALAASNEVDHPRLSSLVDFVRQQLGPEHPLVQALLGGAAFHHAGLPVEVLEALEEAVKDDSLPFLTCTSTLTDGVNLPVRTVVLYDQSYPGQPEDSRLRGARLVNAMGRAGRAGRETEGWIVLVRAAPPSSRDFDDLDPDNEELAVTSSLIVEDALASVAALEQSARQHADAIFSAAGVAADFISFVWLMLSTAETASLESFAADVEAIVDSTLMASQSQSARAVYMPLAEATKRAYLATEPTERRRCPRTGTSISTARWMDHLAFRLASEVDGSQDLSAPSIALSFLGPYLSTLLDLPEAPKWEFRATPRGEDISVDPADLVRSWMNGASLPDLAEQFLSVVEPPSWRLEQIVSAVTNHCEHYFAWTVGALVDLINIHLERVDSEERLCPELAGYVRYGVNDSRALQLMKSGFRSRRLANVVAQSAPIEAGSVDELRSWLSQLGIGDWRDQFAATSSEVLDLVDFTRVRRRSLLRSLLEEGIARASLSWLEVNPDTSGLISLRSLDGETPPAPLAIYVDDRAVALVASGDHSDVQSILDTGFGLELNIESDELTIGLSSED
jgi:hypothetical protein